MCHNYCALLDVFLLHACVCVRIHLHEYLYSTSSEYLKMLSSAFNVYTGILPVVTFRVSSAVFAYRSTRYSFIRSLKNLYSTKGSGAQRPACGPHPAHDESPCGPPSSAGN